MKNRTKNDARTTALADFMLQNPGKDIVITQRNCKEDVIKIIEKLFDVGVYPKVEPKEWFVFIRDIYQIYNGDMDKTVEHIVKGVKE